MFQTISKGSDFCAECGDRLIHHVMHNKDICPNANCKTNKVDWDQPKEPGPVRLPTREEIMADSRKASWHPLNDNLDMPTDRPLLITRLARPGTDDTRWLVARFDPAIGHDSTYIYGLPATHWHEDTLGTP